MNDYVHIQTRIIADKQATEIDRWIGIHIKTKPKWMPQSIYEWLLRTLVELRHVDKPPMTTPQEEL